MWPVLKDGSEAILHSEYVAGIIIALPRDALTTIYKREDGGSESGEK